MLEDIEGNEVSPETATNMLLNKKTVYLVNGLAGDVGTVERNTNFDYVVTFNLESAEEAVKLAKFVLSSMFDNDMAIPDRIIKH